MKRGNNRGKPWYGNSGRNFQQMKAKPSFTVPTNNAAHSSDRGSDDEINPANFEPNTPAVSFSTDREPGAFVGWKLYFPDKLFKESADLVNRIKAIQNHFTSFFHWYDTEAIAEDFVVILKLKNIAEDANFMELWPSFFDDLRHQSTQTLACAGMAMHNIICKSPPGEDAEMFQHQKIYTRPIGYEPHITLSAANQTQGELVSVTGTVKRVEPVKITCKMMCFRCSMCSTELVVKQSEKTRQVIFPSSCHRGCSARGRFVQLVSSPFSMYQPKQMIRLQEAIYKENQAFKTLDVELVQNLVDTVSPGSVVTVTGVVKHSQDRAQKFLKKGEAHTLKCYLKCFGIEIVSQFASLKREPICDNDIEFISMVRAEPSPFRLLVNSFCPTIYGREEVKAGLLLGLLSGNGLMERRRSEGHILLVGNPGSGKSKMLQFCAEVSRKGIFVSGPTSTAVGLTAKVGVNGTVEAGSLVLADGGCCCIDEFDKMTSHAHALLETMEQQTVSITKCGVRTNSSARTVILAAANPVGSFYDESKTMLENTKISAALLSRFDLIFAVGKLKKSNEQGFLNHISSINKQNQSSGSSSFFSKSTAASISQSMDKIIWLHLGRDEKMDTLPVNLLQLYIGYAREHVRPSLSKEAREEIKNFFLQLRSLSVGCDIQPISFRQAEALLRLTLSRARADLAEEATLEHAKDVINLFKFAMTDIFSQDDPTDPTGFPAGVKKPKVVNVSSLSKPKQAKAFMERLQSEVEIQERDSFSRAEMKEMAKELGIKDFEEIVFKLNMDNFILQTTGGYKVV